jgi:imidazole glycerol phosphate synthase subunit HisF
MIWQKFEQCVVVAIDAKQIDGQWIVHLVGGKVPTELNLFDWAKEVEQRGAGEILFTSMDNDGTKMVLQMRLWLNFRNWLIFQLLHQVVQETFSIL